MQSCAAPLTVETTMRVSTPGRHCSGAMFLGSMTFMDSAFICSHDAVENQTPCIHARGQRISISTQENAMAPSSPKIALITGAARGIGLATAKRFLADGWNVALLDIEGALLSGAVADLADPDHTLALPCDVSNAKAVAGALAEIERRFGRLDA